MKILFVHYSRDDREFHCGIAALSAFIKRGGHQSALLIVNDSMTLEEFQAAVEKEAPRIVGFSIMTFQWKKVKELARKVKELGDIPVLAGGFHPTFWPEEVISSPHIDILCRGEGEHATLELLHEMEAGGEHRGIPNIWVKEAGKVISNEIRPLIHDLDTLPYWDYGLFRFEELLKQKAKATAIHQANVAPVAAGRGCPNSCSYCSNATMKRIYKGRGRWVRRRSVSHLLGEMKMLRDRYPVIAYEFWDEQFAVNRRWLEEFCRDYGREIGSPFSIFIRAEMCDLDTLKMLRDAGCMHLWMGVECGNEEYRRKVLNRFQTNEDIVRAFDNARRVGLMTMSLNMIGLPRNQGDGHADHRVQPAPSSQRGSFFHLPGLSRHQSLQPLRGKGDHPSRRFLLLVRAPGQRARAGILPP